MFFIYEIFKVYVLLINKSINFKHFVFIHDQSSSMILFDFFSKSQNLNNVSYHLDEEEK